MDYRFNNSASGDTANLTYDTGGIIDCTSNFTLISPEPLIDWLPNSCLYTKYVPTWHLVRSYQ